jgi:glycosyltransferase involved in cell wall biosynthesis
LDKPFFSIVLPTYNSGLTINTALDSILNQSYRDIEVVVIDGLSNDHTTRVVKEYMATDSRVNFVSEIDEGVYDAMNKGVGRATGQWLYFMGSDDLLYNENVLQDIFEEASKNDVDIIYGNVDSNKLGKHYDGEFDEAKLYGKNICHQAIFIKRDVFNNIGNFNLKYPLHADWDHNIRWFLNNSIKKKYVNRTIAFYADSGLSSRQGDAIFQMDKADIFFKYGGKRLNRDLLKNIYIGMAIRRKQEDKFFAFLFYKVKSWLI